MRGPAREGGAGLRAPISAECHRGDTHGPPPARGPRRCALLGDRFSRTAPRAARLAAGTACGTERAVPPPRYRTRLSCRLSAIACSFRMVVAREALVSHGRRNRLLVSHGRCTDFRARPLPERAAARFAGLCHAERGNPAHPARLVHGSARFARSWRISPAATLRNEFPAVHFPIGLQQPCIPSAAMGQRASSRSCDIVPCPRCAPLFRGALRTVRSRERDEALRSVVPRGILHAALVVRLSCAETL